MGGWFAKSEISTENLSDEELDYDFPTAADEESVAVDASGNLSDRHSNFGSSVLSINEADDYLSIDEKVALAFLLYDGDVKFAFGEIKNILSGQNVRVLSDWEIRSDVENPDDWKNKMIEALTIVKNFKVLRYLGYNKFDLIARYLPKYPRISTYIDKVRKTLYWLCETLKAQEAEVFLSSIEADSKAKNLPFKRGEFLEMDFLNLLLMEYITPLNLTAVYQILARMKVTETILDNLKEVATCEVPLMRPSSKIVQNYTQDKHVDVAGPSSRKLQEDYSVSGYVDDSKPTGGVDLNERYEINEEKPGVCLIINQVKFYRECNPSYEHLLVKNGVLEERLGSEKDRDHLERVFKRRNFRVVKKEDLNHMELIMAIQRVIESMDEESSLFVAILSHGDEGVVYGSNSCSVSHNKIIGAMCCPTLEGKPKVLIVQACQGNVIQKVIKPREDINDAHATDGPTNTTESSAYSADLCILWATVPGNSAIRHKREGSWFIQTFCTKIEQFADKYHLEDICLDIQRCIRRKEWKNPYDGFEYGMTPMRSYTFDKHFYFPKAK